MSTDIAVQTFWDKALENIDSTASELINQRYNAAANRAYYATFHAAIVALLREGIRPPGSQWGHDGSMESRIVGTVRGGIIAVVDQLAGRAVHILQSLIPKCLNGYIR